MGKVLYSATMSLDGFLAGPGGDMPWLTRHLGPNPGSLHRGIGALLVGGSHVAATTRTGAPTRRARSAATGTARRRPDPRPPPTRTTGSSS